MFVFQLRKPYLYYRSQEATISLFMSELLRALARCQNYCLGRNNFAFRWSFFSSILVSQSFLYLMRVLGLPAAGCLIKMAFFLWTRSRWWFPGWPRARNSWIVFANAKLSRGSYPATSNVSLSFSFHEELNNSHYHMGLLVPSNSTSALAWVSKCVSSQLARRMSWAHSTWRASIYVAHMSLKQVHVLCRSVVWPIKC